MLLWSQDFSYKIIYIFFLVHPPPNLDIKKLEDF